MTSISPVLPSPFIDIPGIANFRDIGGCSAGTSGQHVRRGLVYRSADPSRVTDDGLNKMSEELGIKVVFDLRSSQEIKRDGPEWEGLKVDTLDHFGEHGLRREWTPVFADQDYGPDQVAIRYGAYMTPGTVGFARAYKDIATSGSKAYGEVFRHLAKDHPEPCLIHCTAGKDRTGVLTALLYMLVDVEADVIAEEYSLTDMGLAHQKSVFLERLLKNPAMGNNRDGVINMLSSKKENMLASIEMINVEFGGAEKYLRTNCRMNEEEIGQLRANLLLGS